MLAAIICLCGFVAMSQASPWPPLAYARTAATLAQLTQEEKVGLASGNNLNFGKGQA